MAVCSPVRQMAVVVVMLGGVFIEVGCKDNTRASGMDVCIYYKGTAGYDRKVASLPITEGCARERVVAFVQSQSAVSIDSVPRAVCTGRHYVVVGDCYVFSLEPLKSAISLDGYYVNGHTGEVTLKASQGRVPPHP